MIYLLFVCCLAIYIYAAYRLNKVKKHDQVLFPLCQLRRDIMSFLYENTFAKPGALSSEEIAYVRQLLGGLDNAIHNYNQHKMLMFDLRKMAKTLKQYRHTLQQADALKLPSNPEIQNFHAHFELCLVKAFLAYTPLIRSESVLQLVAHAYRASKKANVYDDTQYVVSNADMVREDARRYGVMAGGTTA